MRSVFVIALLLIVVVPAMAQDGVSLFRPARVFDGEQMHRGWVVAVQGDKITYAGEADGFDVDAAAQVVEAVDEEVAVVSEGLDHQRAEEVLHASPEVLVQDVRVGHDDHVDGAAGLRQHFSGGRLR